MLTMPKIFSENALYLHSARLELRGRADADQAVSVTLLYNNEEVASANGMSDGQGDFCVEIRTPEASFKEYTFRVTSGDDVYEFGGVLFGEIWLACGQSNMEMPNNQQPEWETEVSEVIKGKKLRFFNQPKPAHNFDYPKEPATDTDGWWVVPEDTAKAAWVSALATQFSVDLYEFFAAKGEEMPVGFLNCSRGGTVLETWLPYSAFDKYPKIAYKKPDLGSWNSRGDGNYQQGGAHYNYNTHSHLGVKARGMLWYQGESNLIAEQTLHIYKELMIALRETYRDLFSPSEDEVFPIVSSQIYPWRYVDGAESMVGYFNKCFTDLGKMDPERYPYVPICDLSPIWTYHLGNHPIHPAHKYALGKRMALLCLNKYYGRVGRYVQKMPPTLKSFTRKGDKLRLTFDNVGSGLTFNGKKPKGMYIRSKNGAYTPAVCEIVSKNTMLVSHPYIDKPVHCAYAVSSYETATNLMAGEFAVDPFCTEFDDPVTNVEISVKPWLNNELDGELVFRHPFTDTRRDVFVQPIFNPTEGSHTCYDSVYSLSGRSLRVSGDGNTFGVYLKAEQYITLDLENYDAIKMSVYNSDQSEARLILYYKEVGGKRITMSIKSEVEKKLSYGWAVHNFDLTEIPVGTIEKAELSFTHTAGRVPFVNVDNITLVPKN